MSLNVPGGVQTPPPLSRSAHWSDRYCTSIICPQISSIYILLNNSILIPQGSNDAYSKV